MVVKNPVGLADFQRNLCLFQIMKKLYKTTLGYEKWFTKHGSANKSWLHPEFNTLPMLDVKDIPSATIDDDDDDDGFDIVDEDEIDETNVEMNENLSNSSGE